MVPENLRVLVLNDDFMPLNSVHWKKGIKKTFGTTRCEHCGGKGRTLDVQCAYCNSKGHVPLCTVIEYYDIWLRDSANRQHPLPAVIQNRHHVRYLFKKVNFSKLNVFRRDNYTCQYCTDQLHTRDLTLDHVVPRSMWSGGDTPTNWLNIVTCCLSCNRKKDNRTPEQAHMPLRKYVGKNLIIYKKPKQPNRTEIILGLTTQEIPEEWKTYVESILTSSKLDRLS